MPSRKWLKFNDRYLSEQESLANAKVSARQQCVYERKEHNTEKYTQWLLQRCR